MIPSIQSSISDKELHWYSSSIILPELPRVLETLQLCSNLLLYNSPQHPHRQNSHRGPPITLPLSSPGESLKGIVIRDGLYVTKMLGTIKHPQINKVIHKLCLKHPILLDQLLTTKKAIDNAIDIIQGFSNNNNQLSSCHESSFPHSKLVSTFNQLLYHIKIAKQNLQLPLDPGLVFPENLTPSGYFDPELTPNLAIDMYINQTEVCIDVKKLDIITESPWCEITNGKSYVDQVRDEMKLEPGASASPKKLSDWESSHSSSVMESMLTRLQLKPRYDPMDYITKCVTYNDMVVMVAGKVEVNSADPVILITFTKLDSLEYLISSFLDNLNILAE